MLSGFKLIDPKGLSSLASMISSGGLYHAPLMVTPGQHLRSTRNGISHLQEVSTAKKLLSESPISNVVRDLESNNDIIWVILVNTEI